MPNNLSSKSNKERVVYITVPLLLFQLLLLSVQIQNPAGMVPIKTLFLSVQAPLVNISSEILEGIQNTWRRYIWLIGARAENEHLNEEVRQLKILISSLEEIKQENTRLRRLIDMKSDVVFKAVGARVIARTPGFLSNVLYINRGANDGIKTDAPVLCENWIIGRTILVTGGQSQVQLITNTDASIGVMMEQTRTPGVLSGTGELLLDLKYIGNTEPIQTGDIVLSSGLDGIFPKGFEVGKVVEANKSDGVFYTIKVEPTADLYHIEEVSVLITDPTRSGIIQSP